MSTSYLTPDTNTGHLLQTPKTDTEISESWNNLPKTWRIYIHWAQATGQLTQTLGPTYWTLDTNTKHQLPYTWHRDYGQLLWDTWHWHWTHITWHLTQTLGTFLWHLTQKQAPSYQTPDNWHIAQATRHLTQHSKDTIYQTPDTRHSQS